MSEAWYRALDFRHHRVIVSLAENSCNHQKSDLCAHNALTWGSAEREGPRPTPFIISGSKFFTLENDAPDQPSLSYTSDVAQATPMAPDVNQNQEPEMGSDYNQNGSKTIFQSEFSKVGTESEADCGTNVGRSLLNISANDRPGRTEVSNQNQMTSRFWFPRGNRKTFH